MSSLARYTITIDERLLKRFDSYLANHGYRNRSEAIRDLVREALVEEEWAQGGGKVAATVTLVYEHHSNVAERLAEAQHHHFGIVVSATHVHLDNDHCLEVIILRGRARDVRSLADALIATNGVKHGKAVFTTEGVGLY